LIESKWFKPLIGIRSWPLKVQKRIIREIRGLGEEALGISVVSTIVPLTWFAAFNNDIIEAMGQIVEGFATVISSREILKKFSNDLYSRKGIDLSSRGEHILHCELAEFLV